MSFVDTVTRVIVTELLMLTLCIFTFHLKVAKMFNFQHGTFVEEFEGTVLLDRKLKDGEVGFGLRSAT